MDIKISNRSGILTTALDFASPYFWELYPQILWRSLLSWKLWKPDFKIEDGPVSASKSIQKKMHQMRTHQTQNKWPKSISRTFTWVESFQERSNFPVWCQSFLSACPTQVECQSYTLEGSCTSQVPTSSIRWCFASITRRPPHLIRLCLFIQWLS